MKKTLLKVAASIVSLLGGNAALAYDVVAPNSPVRPVHEGLYYIFDAHAINDATTEEQAGGGYCRYAFRFDSGNDNGDIHGTHAKPYNVCAGTTTLTNSHVWKVTTADGGQTWSFQNMGTNKWIKGDACVTSADESAKGLFVIEGDDANGFKIRVNGSVEDRWDGNGGGDYPMVYWGGAGHPIRFYEAVSDGNGGYSIASSNCWNVAYTFTRDNLTYTRTVPLADGADAAANIPAVDFFTAAGLQETGTTVSENTKTFTVTGTWNLPENNTVYRVRNRLDGENYVYVDGNGGIKANSTTVDVELEKTGLWYFKFINFDADGHLICTMHSLSNMTEGVGVTFEDNNDGNASALTDNPTQLTVLPSEGADFALKFTLNGNEHFVNNRDGNFSTWAVAYGAYANDMGCVVRASALTDDDFTALAMTATEDEIDNAKANPTPEAISVLIDKCSPLAMAIVATRSYPIGTGIGQYNNAAGDFAAKLAEAQSLLNDPSATEEQKTAAAEAIAVSNLIINQPASGFYRIKNIGADKLLTSDEVTVVLGTDGSGNQDLSDRLQLIESGNLSNTVWYYDAANQRLVAFANGLCLGKFDTNNRTANWATVLNSDEGVGDVTFTDCGVIGAYAMFTQGGQRRIYGNTTRQDSEGNSYTVSDAGGGDHDNARWMLEPVTWLPMPYDENVGYLTIYTPAPLYMSDGNGGTGTQRVKPYSGTISGDKLVKTEITGNTIPANTPVLLEFLNPAGSHVESGHIFVEVAGPAEVAPANAAANDLIGGIYATTMTDGTNSYVVGKPENGNASFLPAADYLPGFAAHIEFTPEAGADAPASFLISDPEQSAITEVEGAANAAKQVIYDLQGRRVQRAAKGLYIINGVKTLVK